MERTDELKSSPYTKIPGDLETEIIEAIVKTFSNLEFDRLVSATCFNRMENITTRSGHAHQVYDVVSWADRRNILKDLLEGAKKKRPKSNELSLATDRYQDWLNSRPKQTPIGRFTRVNIFSWLLLTFLLVVLLWKSIPVFFDIYDLVPHWNTIFDFPDFRPSLVVAYLLAASIALTMGFFFVLKAFVLTHKRIKSIHLAITVLLTLTLAYFLHRVSDSTRIGIATEYTSELYFEGISSVKTGRETKDRLGMARIMNPSDSGAGFLELLTIEDRVASDISTVFNAYEKFVENCDDPWCARAENNLARLILIEQECNQLRSMDATQAELSSCKTKKSKFELSDAEKYLDSAFEYLDSDDEKFITRKNKLWLLTLQHQVSDPDNSTRNYLREAASEISDMKLLLEEETLTVKDEITTSFNCLSAWVATESNSDDSTDCTSCFSDLDRVWQTNRIQVTLRDLPEFYLWVNRGLRRMCESQ